MTSAPPPLRTRFAPSPTWHIHLGHAASAFHVWRVAEDIGADILLRIEDIDHTRCRPEYETSIQNDLNWLGLEWHGDVRRQSEHLGKYHDVIARLKARELVYRCFKTRSEIASGMTPSDTGEPAAYRGGPLPALEEASRLDAGEPFAWKLSLDAAKSALGPQYDQLSYRENTSTKTMDIPADPAPFGDVVLKRKDIPTSYHIACCHDDAAQGITHIVRGEDLRDVTAIHVLLQTLLGWPHPTYVFHPLVLGDDGKKLSKRNQDKPLRAYREAGVSPAEIRQMIGMD